MIEKELFNKYAPQITGALLLQNFPMLQKVLADMSAEFLNYHRRGTLSALSKDDLHTVISSLTPGQDAIISYAVDLFTKANVKGLREIK